MSQQIDERLVAAVRATGPEATAEAIHEWLTKSEDGSGGLTLENVKTRLGKLARFGAFRQKTAGDNRGRSYKIYSMFDQVAP